MFCSIISKHILMWDAMSTVVSGLRQKSIFLRNTHVQGSINKNISLFTTFYNHTSHHSIKTDSKPNISQHLYRIPWKSGSGHGFFPLKNHHFFTIQRLYRRWRPAPWCHGGPTWRVPGFRDVGRAGNSPDDMDEEKGGPGRKTPAFLKGIWVLYRIYKIYSC